MRYLTTFRFQTKIVFGISAIVVFLTLITGPLVAHMASEALVAESRKRGQALAEGLAMRAVEPMLAADPLRLKNMVDELVGLGDEVLYTFILDTGGRVVAHTYSTGFPTDLVAANHPGDDGSAHIQLLDSEGMFIDDFAVGIEVAGTRFGTARIGLSRQRIQQEVSHLLLTFTWVAAAALALAIALSVFFARRVTRRLAMLRMHAEEIVKGSLDHQAGPRLTRNCWEIMQCEQDQCPAFNDHRRRCWYMAGTMCPTCDNSQYPDKRESCTDCPVYLENVGDEIQDLAETFDVMALTLGKHIEELKEAERVLSDQRGLLRTVLDATPDLVSLMDTRMVYQTANKAFFDFVGVPDGDIQGKTDFDLFPEPVAEQRHLQGRDILEADVPFDMELCLTSEGRERWYHVISIPVRDAKGVVTGLLRTDRDITNLKQYQSQLIQAQKMESLGELAGGVAHEINTPLGVILGYSQLLQDDMEPGSQGLEDLKTIEKQAQVCKKIVADLLGFSRHQETTKREMCFNNSVMEAVKLVQHTFNMNHAAIKARLDDRMPIIYGDPDKLKQVWINLLNNARDAVGQGGTVLVQTKLDTPAQKVTLWIADNGPGIPAEDLTRIFDPFFTTKPVGEGTGLGLSVSFGIVEDHG
ncbi:MAG: ATP-binding protein, partial [Desulfovibrionaceae bacterium]